MDEFSYVKIANETGTDTVRIIHLQPGHSYDIISCNIEHVRLSENPRYEALSYCWGDPKPCHMINCNGRILRIAENLYFALRRLQTSSVRTLWVDAICINQQDIDERNQQVRLMRQIYQQAERAVIWLGEEADNSHLGMALVPKLVEGYKKRGASGDVRDVAELKTSGLRSVYGLPMRSDDAWKGFFGILERPWFQRGWVIQEAAVASSLTIYCGRATISHSDFMSALIFSNDLGIALEYTTPNHGRLWMMGLTRQAFEGGSKQSLLSLLLRHRPALTTDPRDKVFALCGLASDVGSEGLSLLPDYHLTSYDVYRDVAVRMLTLEKNLDILSVPSVHKSSTYPSWVPDFSEPVQTSSLLGLEHNIRELSPYRAALDSECYPLFSDDGRLLCLSGLFFDVIIQTGETQPLEEGDNDAFTPLKDLRDAFEERKRYMNWRKIAGLLAKKKYVTGEDLEDAYWQTLIAGYNPGKGQLEDKARIKALYAAWTRHSFRYAYLRVLPSPFFEWALAGVIVTSFCWVVLKFLMCRPIVSAPHEFKVMMGNAATRKIIKTKQGYIGLAGDAVRVGDWVVICKGGKLPLVTRRKSKHLQLIGDCYLHGIMSGEGLHERDCKDLWFS